MTATEQVFTDHIIEGETGRVFVVERRRWTDAAGNVVGEQVHRRPIEPGDDVSSEDERTRAIIGAEREAAPAERPPREGEPTPPRSGKGKAKG